MISSCIVNFTCDQLHIYVERTYIYSLLLRSTHTVYFNFFAEYYIFYYCVMGLSLITFLMLMIKGGNRIKFTPEEKENDKGKKKSKK